MRRQLVILLALAALLGVGLFFTLCGGAEAQTVVIQDQSNTTQRAAVNSQNALKTLGEQATTGAVIADLAVTTASQQLVASATTRLAIICTNGDAANGIRVGFGATPTATSGFLLQPKSTLTDTGTYAINVIRDTAATANPTISCSTVSQ